MTFQPISGDSHLEIPCDRWTHRVPDRFRDRAPRRVKLPNGGDGFMGENVPLVFGGTGQYSGRDPDEFNPMVAVDFDASVGCGPPEQRLREQDADGVRGELLFPSNTAMKACRGIGDDSAYLSVIRAYNDYLAEEYCAVAPDRLLGVGVLPHRGLEEDIAEMQHCARIGLKTVAVGRYPSGKPYPTAEDDRFWTAALDLGMPMTIHTTLSHGRGQTFKYPIEPAGERPDDDYILRLYRHGHPHSGALEACQMVIAGLFDRFPSLQIYWAENQVGWVPFYYEQMDLEYERNHRWAERVFGVPKLKQRPSEYLRQHAFWGFFDDPLGMRLRHDVGVDRIIWGSDFPHVVTTWPDSVEKLDSQLHDAPADEKERILGGNLAQFLHLS
jgi:uncharacterized protein